MTNRTLATAVLMAGMVVWSWVPATAGSDSIKEPRVTQISATQSTPAPRDAANKIHDSITKDPQFSLLAHRIQIENQNGKVVLHGEVANQEEKLAVGVRARRIAGASNVDNQLQIASTR